MIKESFKRVGLGQKIVRGARSLFGGGAQAARAIKTQVSPEGRIFDKMMAEFVAANPQSVRLAYKGNTAKVQKHFQKFQKGFLQRGNIDPATLKARMPKNEIVLSAQIKRHHRRQLRDPSQVPNLPQQRSRALPMAMAGGAIGLTAAHETREKEKTPQSPVQRRRPPTAGYYGGGGYGY